MVLRWPSQDNCFVFVDFFFSGAIAIASSLYRKIIKKEPDHNRMQLAPTLVEERWQVIRRKALSPHALKGTHRQTQPPALEEGQFFFPNFSLSCKETWVCEEK